MVWRYFQESVVPKVPSGTDHSAVPLQLEPYILSDTCVLESKPPQCGRTARPCSKQAVLFPAVIVAVGTTATDGAICI